VGCRAVAASADFIVSCNAKTLAWGNSLIFKAVWSSTVKNTDTLHGKELQEGISRMVVRQVEYALRYVRRYYGHKHLRKML
jgi:hypothetical protein